MIRINLLKPESKELKEATTSPSAPKVKTSNPGNLVFLLLVIGLGAFYFFQQKSFDRENALLAKARQEKSQLQYVEAKLLEQSQAREALDKKITLIESLNAQRDLAPRLMDEMSRRLPEWVWLTDIIYDAKGIQIRGRALSNNLVADYIAALEASPQLMNVNLVSSTQKTTKADEYLEFALRAAVERTMEAAPAKAGPPTKPVVKKGERP
ncbi:MAG TPA: PilN domain-containing protein [Acidobacteriota bacterium]|nr:PilN domain-containing protein [Acidobacteriota bacterium]